MVHFSGILIAQSVRMRRILLRKLAKSASKTLAKPSKLLSKDEVLYKETSI